MVLLRQLGTMATRSGVMPYVMHISEDDTQWYRDTHVPIHGKASWLVNTFSGSGLGGGYGMYPDTGNGQGSADMHAGNSWGLDKWERWHGEYR